MALVKCPECGKEISIDAKKCPCCGHRVKKSAAQTVLLAIALLFATWVLVMFLQPTLNPESPEQENFHQAYLFIVGSGVLTVISATLGFISRFASNKVLNVACLVAALLGFACFLGSASITSQVTLFAPIILAGPVLCFAASLVARRDY